MSKRLPCPSCMEEDRETLCMICGAMERTDLEGDTVAEPPGLVPAAFVVEYHLRGLTWNTNETDGGHNGYWSIHVAALMADYGMEPHHEEWHG